MEIHAFASSIGGEQDANFRVGTKQFLALPAIAQGLLLAASALLVRLVSGAQVSQFIYQRF